MLLVICWNGLLILLLRRSSWWGYILIAWKGLVIDIGLLLRLYYSTSSPWHPRRSLRAAWIGWLAMWCNCAVMLAQLVLSLQALAKKARRLSRVSDRPWKKIFWRFWLIRFRAGQVIIVHDVLDKVVVTNCIKVDRSHGTFTPETL